MFTKEYEIVSSDVDLNKELTFSSMLRLFQDIATIHGEMIGVGNDEIFKHNLVWVVSRTTIEITKMPKMGDKIVLETAPGEIMRTMFPRFYQIKDINGNVIIKASSIWVLMDFNSRVMVSPDAYNISIDPKYIENFNMFAQNVKTLQYDLTYEKHVEYSDLDYNHHMNNTKYADLVMNALYETKTEKHNYKNFKIVYSKEAKLNDTIVVKYTKNNSLINVCGFVDNQKVFAAELIYE